MQIAYLTGVRLRVRSVLCIVMCTSPLKTNTHYRRLARWIRSGLCDRSDPDVAIKVYGTDCKRVYRWSISAWEEAKANTRRATSNTSQYQQQTNSLLKYTKVVTEVAMIDCVNR